VIWFIEVVADGFAEGVGEALSGGGEDSGAASESCSGVQIGDDCVGD
jgi:hypothetical protein